MYAEISISSIEINIKHIIASVLCVINYRFHRKFILEFCIKNTKVNF